MAAAGFQPALAYESNLSSLGSNLGDREAMLQAAVRALESPRLRIRRLSPIYETEPMDVPGQHWFLNQVAEAETDLFPLQLLHRTAKVEAQLGRRRLAPLVILEELAPPPHQLQQTSSPRRRRNGSGAAALAPPSAQHAAYHVRALDLSGKLIGNLSEQIVSTGDLEQIRSCAGAI